MSASVKPVAGAEPAMLRNILMRRQTGANCSQMICIGSWQWQIAAGAHRFDEAEINQFLNDFLRGPASQARW
jgi:hypothetical protein